MKNSKIIFLVLIAFAFIFVEISYFEKESAKVSPKAETPAATATVRRETQSIPPSAEISPNKIEVTAKTDIETLLRNESSQIGLADEHPEQTEKKLTEMTKGFRYTDLVKLKQKTLNTDINGDDRMLSVYLLSLSQNERVAQILEDIVLSPILIADSKSPAYEFENVLRSQAIEGLQNRDNRTQAIKSLNTLITKVSNSYLLDRSQRALAHYKYNADKLKDQDNKALEKFAQ